MLQKFIRLTRFIKAESLLTMLVLNLSAACMPKRLPDQAKVKIIDPSESLANDAGDQGNSEPLFFAALMVEGEDHPVCGGSFSAPDVVRIAAHCVKNMTETMHILAPNFLSKSHTIKKQGVYPIKAIVSHPGYDRQEQTNDIALIFLKEEAKIGFKKGLHQVIPSARKEDFEELLTQFESGSPPYSSFSLFGRGNRVYPGSYFTKELRKLELQIQDPTIYGGNWSDKTFAAVQAARESNTSRACYGDSGGPTARRLDDGTWQQIGLLSSVYVCASVDRPMFFTRLDHFAPWVKKTIENVRSLDRSPDEARSDLIQIVQTFCPGLGTVQTVEDQHEVSAVFTDISRTRLSEQSEKSVLDGLKTAEATPLCSFRLSSGLGFKVSTARFKDQDYIAVQEISEDMALTWFEATTKVKAAMSCDQPGYRVFVDQVISRIVVEKDGRTVYESPKVFKVFSSAQSIDDYEFVYMVATDRMTPIRCGEGTSTQLALYEHKNAPFLVFSQDTSFSTDESFEPGKRLVWLRVKKPIIDLKFKQDPTIPAKGLLRLSYPSPPDLQVSPFKRKIIGWALRCGGLTRLAQHPSGEDITPDIFAYNDTTYFFSAANETYGTIDKQNSHTFAYELDSTKDTITCVFNGQRMTVPIKQEF